MLTSTSDHRLAGSQSRRLVSSPAHPLSSQAINLDMYKLLLNRSWGLHAFSAFQHWQESLHNIVLCYSLKLSWRLLAKWLRFQLFSTEFTSSL